MVVELYPHQSKAVEELSDGKVLVEWAEVRDNPDYLVSNNGLVVSVRRDRLMCTRLDTRGYISVGLMYDGRQYHKSVHRLVAEVFVPGWDHGLVVNHIDGDKQNNWDYNLEWCTYSDNLRHAHRTGLNSGRGKAIRIVETGDIFSSIAECARELNGSDGRIHDVLTGKRRAYRGLTFEFVRLED
ncbi:HNH endonuclease [Gordonia phage Conley]|nr:HNH endonuclease [Gordonia phage Conley]